MDTVTITINNDFVTYSSRMGLYRGCRSVFDAMTVTEARNRIRGVYEGETVESYKRCLETLIDLPKEVRGIAQRIMASEWEPNEDGEYMDTVWDRIMIQGIK